MLENLIVESTTYSLNENNEDFLAKLKINNNNSSFASKKYLKVKAIL